MDNKSLQLKVEIAWFENFLGLAINLVGLMYKRWREFIWERY